MSNILSSKKIKRGAVGLSLGVGLSLLAILFTNAVQTPVCGSEAKNTRSKTILTAIKKAQKKANGLSNAEVVSHSANRIGFGLAPYVGKFRPGRTADNCTTIAAAVRIANDITLMQRNGERIADRNVYMFLQKYLSPLASANRKTIASLEQERRAIRKIANEKKDIEAIRATNKIYSAGTIQERNSALLRAIFGSQFLNLTTGKMYDRQINLVDQMNEFWFNHFNVNYTKTKLLSVGSDGFSETLRDHMGKNFADLLYAATTHPAMLRYLDNHQNKFICTKKVGRLCTEGEASNQNLGRELIELHALGIGPKSSEVTNSPYTQKDVEEVAKILTGWNTNALEMDTVFVEKFHLPEESIKQGKLAAPKFINHSFSKSSGKARLKELTQILAQHPLTKRNICLKLVGKFYAAAFVRGSSGPYKSCVEAWGNNGNLSAIYLALLSHEDFWTVENYNKRVKNPLEQLASTVRSFGVNGQEIMTYAQQKEKFKFTNWLNPNVKGNGFNRQVAFSENLKTRNTYKFIVTTNSLLANLGLPYKTFIPPTGYPDDGLKWISTGYLNQIAKTSFKVSRSLSFISDGGKNSHGLFDLVRESEAERQLASYKYESFYNKVHFYEMNLGDLMIGKEEGAFEMSNSNVNRIHVVMSNKANWNKIGKVLAPRQTLKEITMNTAEFMFK